MESELLAAILGVLIGTLTGSPLTAWLSRNAARTTATPDPLKEWNAPDIRTFRRDAEIACERGGGGIPAIWSLASPEEQHALSVVAHFHDRVALLYNHRELQGHLTRVAFGGPTAFCEVRLVGSSLKSGYDDEWKPLLARLARLSRQLGSRRGKDVAAYNRTHK